jgi:hypothetical protein
MGFSLIPPDIRGVLPCGHCRHQIVLPFPTPEPAPEDHDSWPNGRNWLYFACPQCRHIAAYAQCRNEVLPQNQAIPREDKVVIRVSFLCAGQSCGVPVQFHILEDATLTETTESELHDLLASGYWTGVGPCAHPIAIVGNQRVSFDLMHEGILRGYNRKHPSWKNF